MSTQTLPRPNTMIGLTHTPEGRMIIREQKALKVGIGYPRGKAADVFIDADGAWNIRVGKKGSDGKMKWETVAKFPTKGADGVIPADPESAIRAEARKKAESAFRKAWKESDVCGYPRKVAFFQFTRPIMGEDGAEVYIPDLEAIESHSLPGKANPESKPGPPTEIDIIFLDDEPFTGGYQMWTASELKCFGDGENASRVLSMALTQEEKALAEGAAKAGKKHFPIVGGCWTCNCPFTKETIDAKGRTQPAPCKPGAEIKFQLAFRFRVGGTAFFHTSSFRTIPQIFSSIERIKQLTGGRIAGIPLKMVIRSHKTNHNGQPAIHQNVAIQFRDGDVDSIRKNLIEQAWKFRAAAGIALPAPAKMIESADAETLEDLTLMTPQAVAGEFYSEDPEYEDAPGEPYASGELVPPVATKTQAKQDAVEEKIRKQQAASAPRAQEATTEPAKTAPRAQETAAAKTAPQAQEVVTIDLKAAPSQPALIAPVPWTDKEGMKIKLKTKRAEVGADVFNAAFSKLGLLLDSLEPNSKEAADLWVELTDTF